MKKLYFNQVSQNIKQNNKKLLENVVFYKLLDLKKLKITNLNSTGIYIIKIKDYIYVGQAKTSFAKRLLQHLNNINKILNTSQSIDNLLNNGQINLLYIKILSLLKQFNLTINDITFGIFKIIAKNLPKVIFNQQEAKTMRLLSSITYGLNSLDINILAHNLNYNVKDLINSAKQLYHYIDNIVKVKPTFWNTFEAKIGLISLESLLRQQNAIRNL